MASFRTFCFKELRQSSHLRSLLFYSQASISNPYYHCHNSNVYKDWNFKKFAIWARSHHFLFAFNDQLSALSLISCSERRDHEANVEVRGQDEVFQETLHVSIPRFPHHLSAVFQPLHG